MRSQTRFRPQGPIFYKHLKIVPKTFKNFHVNPVETFCKIDKNWPLAKFWPYSCSKRGRNMVPGADTIYTPNPHPTPPHPTPPLTPQYHCTNSSQISEWSDENWGSLFDLNKVNGRTEERWRAQLRISTTDYVISGAKKSNVVLHAAWTTYHLPATPIFCLRLIMILIQCCTCNKCLQ